MGITNDQLNAFPVNCGNCLEMKVVGRRGEKRVAKCKEGILDDRVFVLDGVGNNPLPGSWNKAIFCDKIGEFKSMIEEEHITWT